MPSGLKGDREHEELGRSCSGFTTKFHAIREETEAAAVEVPIPRDPEYRWRNLVERLFCKLKS